MQGLALAHNTAGRRCRDVYLQTVMRFFRSTPMLRADAFFDARPIAIAVWMQPDSIQRRPRGLFGIRAQARTPPSPPVSYKIPAVLCGNPQMMLLEEKDREAANIVKLKDDLMSHFRSNFQSK